MKTYIYILFEARGIDSECRLGSGGDAS